MDFFLTEFSNNLYLMAIVQSGFGFICEADGEKILLKETLNPHNSNMWDIFICICSGRDLNGLNLI